MMLGFGYEKPLVVGEYNALWPNLYPEATAAVQEALAGLYELMVSLPPQLQMFMRGCPQELEDKRDRINRHELVMRNLLALSAGVRRRHPSAETFALLADQLRGVEQAIRLEAPARPGLYLFEVRRRGRGPLLVVWEQRDSFDGEDEPPVPFGWPWPAQRAAVVDALGQAQPAEVADGRVQLQVSLTPLFVTAA